MSIGGSTETTAKSTGTQTTTPQIPADLHAFLTARTNMLGQNAAGANTLLAGLESGDQAVLSPYTAGAIPGIEQAGQRQRTQILEARDAQQGGQLSQRLANTIAGTEGQRAQGQSTFATNLLNGLFAMLGAQRFPVGSTGTESGTGTGEGSQSPGVLDYLNALANASQGLGYRPGQTQQGGNGGAPSNWQWGGFGGAGGGGTEGFGSSGGVSSGWTPGSAGVAAGQGGAGWGQ